MCPNLYTLFSILIPTYNYNVYPLVEELHRQCSEINNLEFEILVFDDGSQLFHAENLKINNLSNCYYCILEKNSGRTATRNLLAQNATFENLLFLDTDVRVISSNFIINYLPHLNKPEWVVFGGCDYHHESYSFDTSLRFHYGKKREAINSSKRNLKPYKHILSANFLISKKEFLALDIPNQNAYGMDLFFSYLLIKHQKKILHINNAVWHCGLEKNEVFLEKSMKSVRIRKEQWRDIKEISDNNSLLKTYNQLNFFPLNVILKGSFKLSNKTLKKCFFKPVPILWAFDLYRLLYLFSLN